MQQEVKGRAWKDRASAVRFRSDELPLRGRRCYRTLRAEAHRRIPYGRQVNSRIDQTALLSQAALLSPAPRARAPRRRRPEGLPFDPAKLLSLRTGLVFEVLKVAIEPAYFTVMLKLTEKPIEQRASGRLEL